MRIFLLLLLLCPLLLLFSCKKYSPAKDAFFLRTSQVSVATNTFSQGSGSHKITDLWLYVNGQFQGAYAVGNLMPVVLKDNKAKISVFAGIKNNGISGTRLAWVFYDRFDLDTVVEAGKTIDRNVTFHYNSTAVFTLTESFDQQGVKFIDSPVSSAKAVTISPQDGAYEGKSLKVELTSTVVANTALARIESASSYTLPLSSPNVYVEFNYKCNAEFSMGMMGTDNIERPVLFINPQGTWNKIYVPVAEIINQSPTSSSYKMYFKMVKVEGNDNPQLFLDNIKLVYL